MKRIIVVFTLLVLHVGCTAVPPIENRAGIVQDKLTSWQDGPVKSKIVAFVTAVCDPQSNRYVRAEDRRAFFDMDGTILCEKPEYIEVELTKHRLREKAAADPELAQRPLYKAALEYNNDYINKHVKDAILEAFAGEELNSLDTYWRNYLASSKHPSLSLEYARLFYLPMIELIRYLQDMEFSVFIVSTSQQEFIRSFPPDSLPVPKENIIGTVVGFELRNLNEDKPHSFIRIREYFDPYNADNGKAVRLRERGLEAAILAAGNSMGDYAMLDGVSDGKLPNLILIVDHDDPNREFQYRKADLLSEAKKRNWVVISMKKDFRFVFTGRGESDIDQPTQPDN